MFTPPLFKKFGKSLDDLLKKKYGAKKEFKVKSSTQDGTSFESTVAFTKESVYTGALKATHKFAAYGKAEAEIDTLGAFKGSFESADKLAKGVTVKVSTSEKPQGTVEVDYVKDAFTFSGTVDQSRKVSVEGASSIGHEGLSVGGQVKYNATEQLVSDYNVGLEYSQTGYTATVKTEDQADNVVFSYIHQISSALDLGPASATTSPRATASSPLARASALTPTPSGRPRRALRATWRPSTSSVSPTPRSPTRSRPSST